MTLISNAYLFQRIGMLSGAQHKELFAHLAPFMTSDNGFFPFTNPTHHSTRDSESQNSFLLENNLGDTIFFRLFTTEIPYTRQFLSNSAIVLDNDPILGVVEFAHGVVFGFMPTTSIWIKFAFTEKFFSRIRNAYNTLYGDL